jgi:hypothetical protein
MGARGWGSMPTPDRPSLGSGNPFQDWMMAMANRRGELDLRMENVTLQLPFIPHPVALNGTVTVSFHIRDLSEREREAREARELRLLKA